MELEAENVPMKWPSCCEIYQRHVTRDREESHDRFASIDRAPSSEQVPPSTKAVFGGSLPASLLDAVDLAEQRYREIQARQRQLTENLRKDILLSALRYERPPHGVELKFQQPPAGDRPTEASCPGYARGAWSSPCGFRARSRSLFQGFLEEVARLVKNQKEFRRLLKDGTEHEKNLVLNWAINAPQFSRITTIVSYVEEFIKRSREVNEPIDRFLRIVNGFLHDGNKDLCFDETGTLSVSIRRSEPIPVTSLSSGESQIVVIITHLSYNPMAKQANVFIVDEPELSLHVRWQELFVKSITEASPGAGA